MGNEFAELEALSSRNTIDDLINCVESLGLAEPDAVYLIRTTARRITKEAVTFRSFLDGLGLIQENVFLSENPVQAKPDL